MLQSILLTAIIFAAEAPAPLMQPDAPSPVLHLPATLAYVAPHAPKPVLVQADFVQSDTPCPCSCPGCTCNGASAAPVTAEPVAAPVTTSFSGPQFSGPQFSGPQFSGPQFSGPRVMTFREKRRGFFGKRRVQYAVEGGPSPSFQYATPAANSFSNASYGFSTCSGGRCR